MLLLLLAAVTTLSMEKKILIECFSISIPEQMYAGERLSILNVYTSDFVNS